MKTILFVCTGNTCRSPMAQALFQKYLRNYQESAQGQDFKVFSAGISTQDGLPASQEAIQVMQDENIDLSGHYSLRINEHLISQADYILTMSIEHRNYLWDKFPARIPDIFDLRSFAGEPPGDIIDPFGAGITAYQETVEQLNKLLSKIMKKVMADPHNGPNGPPPAKG